MTFAAVVALALPAQAWSAADAQAAVQKPNAGPVAKPPAKPAKPLAQKTPVPPQMAELMARREALCKKRPQLCGGRTERLDPAAVKKTGAPPLAAPAMSATPKTAAPPAGAR